MVGADVHVRTLIGVTVCVCVCVCVRVCACVCVFVRATIRSLVHLPVRQSHGDIHATLRRSRPRTGSVAADTLPVVVPAVYVH